MALAKNISQICQFFNLIINTSMYYLLFVKYSKMMLSSECNITLMSEILTTCLFAMVTKCPWQPLPGKVILAKKYLQTKIGASMPLNI